MVSRTSGMGSVTNQSVNTGGKTTTQAGTTTTTGNSSTRGGSNESQTFDLKNMTGSSLLALEQLINGLSGPMDIRGPIGRNKSGENNTAVQSLLNLSKTYQASLTKAANLGDDYSKSAAFQDSAAASAAQLAEALEQSMPTITAGIDAAGTSGSALSALLTQRAAEDAAAQAAKLGLDAAIAYGQINAQSQSAVASLLGQGDPATNALLAALGIAKGAVQTGTVKSSGSNWSNTNSSQTQTSVGTTNESGQTQTSTTKTTPTGTSSSGSKTGSVQSSGSGQSLITPSAYRTPGGNSANSGNTSYSQFRN